MTIRSRLPVISARLLALQGLEDDAHALVQQGVALGRQKVGRAAAVRPALARGVARRRVADLLWAANRHAHADFGDLQGHGFAVQVPISLDTGAIIDTASLSGMRVTFA